MARKKKVETVKLSPGPYATHFQEYAHDKYFGGPQERESFTQQPRTSLTDFLANRLELARRSLRDAGVDEEG